jgi:hypothetical protein
MSDDQPPATRCAGGRPLPQCARARACVLRAAPRRRVVYACVRRSQAVEGVGAAPASCVAGHSTLQMLLVVGSSCREHSLMIYLACLGCCACVCVCQAEGGGGSCEGWRVQGGCVHRGRRDAAHSIALAPAGTWVVRTGSAVATRWGSGAACKTHAVQVAAARARGTPTGVWRWNMWCLCTQVVRWRLAGRGRRVAAGGGRGCRVPQAWRARARVCVCVCVCALVRACQAPVGPPRGAARCL